MPRRYHYDAEVLTVARNHGLDPKLVKAITLVESSGQTHAYRYEPAFWMRYLANKPEYDGAVPERVAASYGLMQVMYPTARQHGYADAPEGLFVPLVGLDYGCRHLKWLLNRCNGDVEMALAQYNGGEHGNLTRPFRNTAYVVKVKQNMEAL